MSKNVWLFIIGIGVTIVILFLDKQVEKMPIAATMTGYILGGLLIALGVIFLIRGKRMKEDKNIHIDESVTSIGQQGGQTARNIYNVGLKPQRKFTIEESLIERLAEFRGTPYGIAYVHGDGEAQAFATQIDTLLQRADWTRVGAGRATLMASISYGVDLRWRDDSGYGEAMNALMACLQEIGFKAQRTDEKRLQDPEVFVRSNENYQA